MRNTIVAARAKLHMFLGTGAVAEWLRLSALRFDVQPRGERYLLVAPCAQKRLQNGDLSVTKYILSELNLKTPATNPRHLRTKNMLLAERHTLG